MKHYDNTQQFYNGTDWAQCKAQVLQERTKGDGAIYCEHCGQIINKGFNPKANNNGGAIVFHHKKYLTNYNVNDASISINPNNIAVVHWACHNEIHDRQTIMLKAKAERKVYIVVGAPCSGNVEWVKERAQAGDLILNINDIWQSISEQDEYVKPKQLTPIVFKIRDSIKEAIALGIGSWRNAYIIEGATLALEADRTREANKYKANNVEVVIMATTKEECIKRLLADPQGRNVEEYTKYINEYYTKFV